MRRALLPSGLLGASMLACGLSSIGTGDVIVDDAGALDSGFTSPDTGAALDSGESIDAGTVVDAAPAGTFYCPPTKQMVAGCSQCNGNPLHCELCTAGTATVRYDVCVPAGGACLGQYGNGKGLYWCPCSYPSAANCPLPEQECNFVNNRGVCVTCGENLTNGYQCKSGGRCDQGSSTCK